MTSSPDSSVAGDGDPATERATCRNLLWAGAALVGVCELPSGHSGSHRGDTELSGEPYDLELPVELTWRWLA